MCVPSSGVAAAVDEALGAGLSVPIEPCMKRYRVSRKWSADAASPARIRARESSDGPTPNVAGDTRAISLQIRRRVSAACRAGDFAAVEVEAILPAAATGFVPTPRNGQPRCPKTAAAPGPFTRACMVSAWRTATVGAADATTVQSVPATPAACSIAAKEAGTRTGAAALDEARRAEDSIDDGWDATAESLRSRCSRRDIAQGTSGKQRLPCGSHTSVGALRETKARPHDCLCSGPPIKFHFSRIASAFSYRCFAVLTLSSAHLIPSRNPLARLAPP